MCFVARGLFGLFNATTHAAHHIESLASEVIEHSPHHKRNAAAAAPSEREHAAQYSPRLDVLDARATCAQQPPEPSATRQSRSDGGGSGGSVVCMSVCNKASSHTEKYMH